MASTRRANLQVWEDEPDASYGQEDDRRVETALWNALGSFNGSADGNAPSPTDAAAGFRPGASPKKNHSSPLQPLSVQSNLQDIKIPPPSKLDFSTDSLQKNPDFQPTNASVEPAKQLFPPFMEGAKHGKETFHESTSFQNYSFQDRELEYGHKAPLKRTSHEAPLGKDRASAKKQKMEEEEPFELPDPSEMPSVVDDGAKPLRSYAELIGMAILRAPGRRLTLAQIYKWISDSYTFYRESGGSGWQNSIRHNLSLNKNFVKQERPKDDPGKGHYWAIRPGQERSFLVDKKNPLRRITNPDGSQYFNGLPQDMSGTRPSTAPAIGQFTLAPNTSSVRKVESKAIIDSAKFPDETDFPSDGTIPASDPALQEEDGNDIQAMPPPHVMRSSPPPHDIGSSPPPMMAPTRKATPPPVPRFPSTSRSGGRKNKFAGMNDSGYWSSIESSAVRGAAHILTSEADLARPRIKKGRAEEEIARIRSSSFDSPTKDKQANKPLDSQYESSSPAKGNNPLTPAVVFKRPVKAPLALSPNTSLRNHREGLKALLGSPAKPCSPVADAHSWSPAFNFGDDTAVGLTPYISPYKTRRTPWKPAQDTPGQSTLFNNALDVFIDVPEDDLTARGSPEKRSAKRPALGRAATSSGILADITGSSRGNTLLRPSAGNSLNLSFSPLNPKSGNLRSPARLGSPLKQSHAVPEPHANFDWFNTGESGENYAPGPAPVAEQGSGDLFGINIPSDGSEDGIDLFQDFGKIGTKQQTAKQEAGPDRSTGSPVKRSMLPPARPSINRTQTNRW